MPERDSGLSEMLMRLRPKLHRYCARMTGSVIDGEDIVQDALIKAMEALPAAGTIASLEGWVFRIAHNTALDFLRRRSRRSETETPEEDLHAMPDPDKPVEARQAVAASLRTFMRLAPAQRGSVILTDVLGYSLEEAGTILDSTVPAVKSALHRARTRLKELAREPEDRPPPRLSEPERALFAAYVERFNARDFDAVRAMLAEEVRLDLVGRSRTQGRTAVSRYFGNYAGIADWHLSPGLVEGRPAVLVHHPDDPAGRPAYFVLLDWDGDRLSAIRDYRYARHVADEAEITPI